MRKPAEATEERERQKELRLTFLCELAGGYDLLSHLCELETPDDNRPLEER